MKWLVKIVVLKKWNKSGSGELGMTWYNIQGVPKFVFVFALIIHSFHLNLRNLERDETDSTTKQVVLLQSQAQKN